MLYKDAANLAQRLWAAAVKGIDGMPRTYKGAFRRMLPVANTAGTHIGASRAYNIGKGFLVPKALKNGLTRWSWQTGGTDAVMPLPDEGLQSRLLLSRIFNNNAGQVLSPGMYGTVYGLALRPSSIIDAVAGKKGFVDSWKRGLGRRAARDVVDANVPFRLFGATTNGRADSPITYGIVGPITNIDVSPNAVFANIPDPLKTKTMVGNPIGKLDIESPHTGIAPYVFPYGVSWQDRTTVPRLLPHEYTHALFLRGKLGKNNNEYVAARGRLNQLADKLGIDPYLLEPPEAAQYGMALRTGVSAVNNASDQLIPPALQGEVQTPNELINAIGRINGFGNRRDVGDALRQLKAVPIQQQFLVSDEFARPVLSMAQLDSRRADAASRRRMLKELNNRRFDALARTQQRLLEMRQTATPDRLVALDRLLRVVESMRGKLHDNERDLSSQIRQFDWARRHALGNMAHL